ncbi:c-type cytochrome [Thalassotalea sp. G2M2-11]|uniref:c-type cytochrome n=1 Tax=Thalassotalea sp. G2M2-11 TaxID=2787627 RepID=UPI0019D318EE|nr:c-type cytochrome [Thalassotalea sp. G2M2-11]
MLKTAIIGVALSITLSTAVHATDGKKIVDQSCATCHAVGAANAPKIGDKAAWKARKAKGIEALLASVKNGLNAMPAGGMCNDCSDEDYKAAIEHMAK